MRTLFSLLPAALTLSRRQRPASLRVASSLAVRAFVFHTRVARQHAGFDSDYAKSYPTAGTQAAFLAAYVRAATPSTITTSPSRVCTKPGLQVEGGNDFNNSLAAEEGSDEAGGAGADTSDEAEFLEALRTEVNRWSLPSHLWWAAWAVVQARYSPIDFDFVDYARLRLAGYRLHKAAFFGSE